MLGVFTAAAGFAADIVLTGKAPRTHRALGLELGLNLSDSCFEILNGLICFHIREHSNAIGYEKPIFTRRLTQALSSPLAGLAARPPASAPRVLPHHHLPVAGGRAGSFVPAPRPGGGHQPGPQFGPFGRQLLLPPTLFSFPGAGSGP